MDVKNELKSPKTFEAWRDQVERRLADTLGRGAAALEREVGTLPLELGWESGDSADEFVVGAVLPLFDQPEAR